MLANSLKKCLYRKKKKKKTKMRLPYIKTFINYLPKKLLF